MTAERSRAYLAGLVFDRLMEIPDSDRRRSESEGSAHAQARASRGASLIHLGRGRLRVRVFRSSGFHALRFAGSRGGPRLASGRPSSCRTDDPAAVALVRLRPRRGARRRRRHDARRRIHAVERLAHVAGADDRADRRQPDARAAPPRAAAPRIRQCVVVPRHFHDNGTRHVRRVLPGHEPHDGFARSVGVAMAASVDRARARLSRVRADLVQAGAAVVFGAASIRGKVVGTRRNSRQHDADCARLAFFWIAVLSASPAAGRTDSHCGTDNAAGPHSQHLRCHHAPVGDRAQNDLRGQRTVHRGRCFPDRAEREVLGLHQRDGVVVVDDVRDAADQDATRAAQFRPRGSRTRWSRLRGAGTRNARASRAICTTTSTSASRSCRSVSARCV